MSQSSGSDYQAIMSGTSDMFMPLSGTIGQVQQTVTAEHSLDEQKKMNAFQRKMSERQMRIEELLGMQKYKSNEELLQKNRDIARYLSIGKY